MEEKRNFFKDIWTSIRDFEKYEVFAADKLLKAIGYIVLLTLIFAILVSLTYTYKLYSIVQGTKEYIENNIEEISLIDGKLNVSSEEPLIIENEKSIIPIIIIDTSEEANIDEHISKIDMYGTGLLVLSDRVVVASDLINETQSISYSNLFENDIENKTQALNLLTEGNIYYIYATFCITIFIYLFVVFLASNIVDGVVLGVLGYLFARIVKMKLRFRATFNIGLHALTLPIILNLIYIIVNTITGFNIAHFQWMYTSISYIYVAVAILMIKTEIINQKIQLMRLEKIQEQVSKEEREKEEDKQEKKEEKKEENKKEENDEKEKKPKQGEQPEGSNA